MLTPVRRSTRRSIAHTTPHRQALENANFTFTPNKHLACAAIPAMASLAAAAPVSPTATARAAASSAAVAHPPPARAFAAVVAAGGITPRSSQRVRRTQQQEEEEEAKQADFSPPVQRPAFPTLHPAVVDSTTQAAVSGDLSSPLTPAMRALRLHDDDVCTPVPASPCHVTPAPPPPSAASTAASGDSPTRSRYHHSRCKLQVLICV